MKLPKTFVPEKNLDKSVTEILEKEVIKINNLEIELEVDEELLTFDKSLERLKKAGYERHLRPCEYFTIAIEYLEGTLEKRHHETAKRVLYHSKGQWLSMAVKKEGETLTCYTDPENFKFIDGKYIVDESFRYHDKKEFYLSNVIDRPHVLYLETLNDINESIIKFFYTRKFEDLPVAMKEGIKNPTYFYSKAFFYLPSDGVIRPLNRSFGTSIFSTYGNIRNISRGVKETRK